MIRPTITITRNSSLFIRSVGKFTPGSAEALARKGARWTVRTDDGVLEAEDVVLALGPWSAGAAQFLIAIYGGYFGGGIGFLMLAALTIAGMPVRNAAATKNVLAGTMNASAVLVFLFSRDVHWVPAAVLGLGAILGGAIGAEMLNRINDRWLRVAVIALGAALTVGLFVRGH